MKKQISFIVFILCSLLANAQIEYEIPDFIGEVMVIREDNSSELLEKNYTQIKTKDVFDGIATKMYVDGKYSPTRLIKGKHLFIVKAVDNRTDPMSIIRLFKFSVGTNRKVTLDKINAFSETLSSGPEYNNVGYKAKKYGEDCYLITVDLKYSGEYGFMVLNPNGLDQKMAIVLCFGVDDNDKDQDKRKTKAKGEKKKQEKKLGNNGVDWFQ